MKMNFNIIKENDKQSFDEEKLTVSLWQSREIFGGKKLVMIKHNEILYRLMITRQGKLILTK